MFKGQLAVQTRVVKIFRFVKKYLKKSELRNAFIQRSADSRLKPKGFTFNTFYQVAGRLDVSGLGSRPRVSGLMPSYVLCVMITPTKNILFTSMQ